MRTVLAPLLFVLAITGFDHQHDDWTQLLSVHVDWADDSHNTTVDYAGFASMRQELQRYLDMLSAVDESTFDTWIPGEQLAFLINAYNAWTVELILRHSPGISSIRQIGGLFSSPWRQRFIPLLGEMRTLDEIEHEMIRGAPDFAEPRIHFAVNCASIGCPALRPEAYRAKDLEGQLEDQTLRFMSDRSRNSFDARRGQLTVSPLFRWYSEDFKAVDSDMPQPRGFIARYADDLANSPEDVERLRTGDYRLRYSTYDWSLNKKP